MSHELFVILFCASPLTFKMCYEILQSLQQATLHIFLVLNVDIVFIF